MKRNLSLLSFGLCLLVLTGCPSGPKDTVQSFGDAVKNDKPAEAWDLLCKADQEAIDDLRKMMVPDAKMFEAIPDEAARKKAMEDAMKNKVMGDKTAGDLKDMAAKDFFVLMMSDKEDKDNPMKDFEILSEKVEGDSATVKVKSGDKESDIKLVKEDGNWKVKIYSAKKE